ncbi:hypothetical protein GCM10023074_34430 [Microbispora amethystogenes]|uniref:Uncharacterized protein n=1 Tax=Microbispora amethystogenes TaxID=1427754 RepID=A0ABQ4FAR5_9ACTN|nr:hypothetical protein Mam01_20610 [Microbispora amethystogenes]
MPEDGSDEDRVLGGKPGQRLVKAGEGVDGYPRLRRGQGERIASRVQQQRRGMSGMQVVVENPEQRRVPIGVAVPAPGQLGGVGA